MENCCKKFKNKTLKYSDPNVVGTVVFFKPTFCPDCGWKLKHEEPKKATCESCMWWFRHSPNNRHGFCIRKAPSRPDDPGAYPKCIWPETSCESFCGDHEPNEDVG